MNSQCINQSILLIQFLKRNIINEFDQETGG